MKIIQGEHYITQGYGLTEFAKSPTGKRFYKNFPGGIHPGIDFGTKGAKLPVLSPITGKVVRASEDGGWGVHVEVQGKDGWNVQFAHLASTLVKVGQDVKIGDSLGRVGNTGSSTAVHLHFGSRRRKLTGGWEYRDPTIYLEDTVEDSALPSEKLIKAPNKPDIYIFNGKKKFPIFNWGTLVFLFGTEPKIETVDEAVLSKIPEGDIIPMLD